MKVHEIQQKVAQALQADAWLGISLSPKWRDLSEQNKVYWLRIAGVALGALAPRVARPLNEWSEDDGSVLWWKFPIDEPPYVGTPNDLGRNILVTVDGNDMVCNVGGWPGYHTHWTPLPSPPVAPPAPIPPIVDDVGGGP